ncbi:MAG: Gfo/Idh/MocA family protein [Vicinamibacterales bacterium]
MFQWGLFGAGDIVQKRVAAALRDAPNSRLVAVARARAELAEAFAISVGAGRSYARWQDLLAAQDVDGVYIATPVHLHAEQAIAAAQAGKHVLCEKPMAMSTAECDRMIAACRANGVKLGVAYYRHFYPIVVRIKEILTTGHIGRPVLAQINAFERFNPAPDDARHWFVRRAESGGGPMFDFGCHRLEVLLNWFGAVARVTGKTANVVFDRDVEDTATACVLFENGPIATVAVTHAAMEPQDTLDVFGTAGSVHVANLNAGELRILTAAGEQLERHAPPANLHAPLVGDFVASVASGHEPAVNGEIGRAVASLEDAIYGRV